GLVALLVGVDEGEIDLRRPRQGAKRVEGRRDLQRDALGDAGPREVAPRDGRPLLAHVAAQEVAARGEPARDGDGAVAREGADLDGAARADQASEPAEERRLLDRDLHQTDRSE